LQNYYQFSDTWKKMKPDSEWKFIWEI